MAQRPIPGGVLQRDQRGELRDSGSERRYEPCLAVIIWGFSGNSGRGEWRAGFRSRRAPQDSVGSEIDFLAGSGNQLFQSGVATYSRVISATVRVPQLPIASFSSPCIISSTRSTPAWPNAPSPQRKGRPIPTALAPSAKALKTSVP